MAESVATPSLGKLGFVQEFFRAKPSPTGWTVRGEVAMRKVAVRPGQPSALLRVVRGRRSGFHVAVVMATRESSWTPLRRPAFSNEADALDAASSLEEAVTAAALKTHRYTLDDVREALDAVLETDASTVHPDILDDGSLELVLGES